MDGLLLFLLMALPGSLYSLRWLRLAVCVAEVEIRPFQSLLGLYQVSFVLGIVHDAL